MIMEMTFIENTMDFIGNFCRFVVLSFVDDRRQQQTGFRRVFFFPIAHCRFATTKREVKIQDARDKTFYSRLPPRRIVPRTVTPRGILTTAIHSWHSTHGTLLQEHAPTLPDHVSSDGRRCVCLSKKTHSIGCRTKTGDNLYRDDRRGTHLEQVLAH